MITLTQPGSTFRSLAEARVIRTPGELEQALVALAKEVKAGNISPDIDPSIVSKNQLTGKVSDLRKRGKLTLDIGVVKTKSGGYAIARYTEPRVSPFAKWKAAKAAARRTAA